MKKRSVVVSSLLSALCCNSRISPQEIILVISLSSSFLGPFLSLLMRISSSIALLRLKLCENRKSKEGAWSRIQHQTNCTNTVVLVGRKKTQGLGLLFFLVPATETFTFYYYYLELQVMSSNFFYSWVFLLCAEVSLRIWESIWRLFSQTRIFAASTDLVG